MSDLRARRLCGRHQITADGKHLIDGVPFGLPFLHRNNSNRPAITIPPRKKRRTVLSGWEPEAGYGDENDNADEEGDGEWLPPSDTGFGKELSILPVDQEPSDMGTVIRHPVDYDVESESEGDGSSPEENELESELKALKEDFDEPESQFIDIRNQTQAANRPSLRSASMAKRPSSADTLRRGSLVGASSLSSKRSRGEDSSPRTSKAVRFNKGNQGVPRPSQAEASAETSESEEAASSSGSSDASSSDEEEDDSDSSDENDEDDANSDSAESSDPSSEDSDSSSESEEEEEEEEASPPAKKARVSTMTPPGQGSIRTRKSNNRFKLRRRLSKLKEIGKLPADADFAALHQWQEENGGFHIPEEPSVLSTPANATDPKEQEKLDFEAKRQKLLEALASGGVDVEETSEKENVPPRLSAPAETTVPEEAPVPEQASEAAKAEAELSNRRTLDIASSRRLLFGSLGMRTPKTKEEEDAARQKLAAKASTVPTPRKAVEPQEVEQEEAEADVNWQDKLEIKATECLMDDIELSAPPFPFVQRWDEDAHAIIAERKGWGKKRKRKNRIQVYNGDGYGDDDQDGNEDYDGDVQLNYDDEWPTAEDEPPAAENLEDAPEPVDDLPVLPNDLDTISDLLECEAKVGAIIAFRQLDMSKATNWQPRMSEYRVAEVHKVLDNGSINVRLAIRDRKPKQQPEDPEDDQPRRYSGFEMPGFDDAEEEDDGYRELAFAELCEPKLLRPAPSVMDDTNDKDQDNAQEDSLSV